MKSFLPIITFLFAMPMCLPVSAELMGMVPGRSAYVPTQASVAVEVGANWYTDQLQWTGARVNFKPSPRLVTYIDIAVLRATDLPTASARRADFVGTGYGGGLMFAVPDFLATYDLAFNASYHASVIDETDFNENSAASQDTNAVPQALQQSQWIASFLLSPIDPFYENGTSWYTSLGFVSTAASTKAEQSSLGTSTAVEYQQINGVAFGAGIYKPISKGRLYAGYEYLSGDPLFGVGFSFSIR